MKKYFRFLMAAFAATAALSCQQERLVDNTKQEETPDSPRTEVVWTLKAGFAPSEESGAPSPAPASKVSLNDVKMSWSVGDKIVVNGITSLALTAEDIDDDPSCATFNFTSTPEGEDLVAIYPASAYKGNTETTTSVTDPESGVASDVVTTHAVVDFPADQSYDPATEIPCILVGSCENGNCDFKHAAAYLELVCDQPVKSVRVMANAIQTTSTGDWRAGMALSGVRSIDLNKNYLTEVMLEDIGNTITADFGDAGTTDPIILAVPPRNYTSGLNFFVITTDGKYKIFRAASGFNFTSKLGKILSMNLSMEGSRSYEGPGIYTLDDWCSFADAFERTYVDASDIHFGSIAEWTDSDGEVHIRKDITVQGNLHRIGARHTSITYSDNETPFTAVLNGDGHTITQTASLVPLMLKIAPTGVVKNLTLSGAQTKWSNNQMSNTAFCKFNEGTIENCVCDIDYTFSGATKEEKPYYLASFCMDNLGTMTDCKNTGNITVGEMVVGNTMMYKVASIAGLVKDNQGTMTRCYNEGEINASGVSVSLNFAGVAVYNSGTMTNCENRAPITIDYTPTTVQIFYGGGVAAAADDAYSFEASIPAAASKDIKATRSGSFYGCSNTGNITVFQKPTWTGQYLRGNAFGGIVGAINHGQFADPNDHNYTAISGCTNSGSIKVLSNTTTWGASNSQVGIAVGGILGRACAYATTGYGPYDVNNKSTLPGNFFAIGLSSLDSRWTISNTGDIEVTSTNTSGISAATTGARQVYAGGIVGFATGGYKTDGTTIVYSIIRYASSEGTIKIGGTHDSAAAGGLAGGCANVKLIACKSTTTFQRSAGTDGLLIPTKTGLTGGAAGWVSNACQIQDCRISMTATDSPKFAGFMNLKDGVDVKKITTKSTFTGTIGGVAVTEDVLNGTTDGKGTYSGDVAIEIN